MRAASDADPPGSPQGAPPEGTQRRGDPAGRLDAASPLGAEPASGGPTGGPGTQRYGVSTQPLGPGECPFLERIRYQEGYPVEAYCAALENGQLMIPSIAEYRDLCSSGGHESCRIFRRRAAPERKAA